jgi:hypothetical protein
MQGEQTVSCRKEFATGSDPGQRNAVVLEEWSSQIIMMLQPLKQTHTASRLLSWR